MTVFVDTSAWIALFVAGEDRHKAAAREYRNLSKENELLCTTDYVLSETLTRIRALASHKKAVEIYGQLMEAEKKRMLRVFWTERPLFEAAWKIFSKYHDKTFSFVDCVSFATMNRHKLRRAFTFDRDFAILRFDMLPEPPQL